MVKILSVLMLLALVVGGSGLSGVSAATDWQCPDGLAGQTLRIFGWAEYVAETTIPDFEAACDVTVEYFEYLSSDGMLNTMQTGTSQFDLVVSPAGMARIMVNLESAQPLDHSLLPNLENVTLDPVAEFVGLQMDYLIMYQGASIGIAYDTTIVAEPLTTWADFFAYEGRVAWMDDARWMLGIANTVIGNFVASFDEADLAAAADYLLTQPRNDVFAITSDSQEADLLLQGEVDAIIVTSGGAARLMRDCACEDYVYVIPEDGLLFEHDVMAIPASAENVALAHAFIDYILQPQVNADLSSALGTSAVVLEAHELVDAAIYNNGVSYISFETLMGFLDDFLGMEERDGMETVGMTMDAYGTTWNDIKAEYVSR